METETVFRLNECGGVIGGGHETRGTNVKDTTSDSVDKETMALFDRGEKLTVCMIRRLDCFWSGRALYDNTRHKQ